MLDHPSKPYLESLTRLLTSESKPKLGLSKTQALLKALGNPERQFSSFHVTGTNGKGSTCAFLNSLLMQSSDRVGLYTSPHLLCARERIQINGRLISEQLFCEAEAAVSRAAATIGDLPTFFESMTAMAFWVFAKEKIDRAVIEVGLGGRLDATNVIRPLVSVITRIDLDHTDILGDTLEAIALEKSGIIKDQIPIVTGWQEDEVLRTIRSVAQQHHAPFIETAALVSERLGLSGEHQSKNAALALAAVEVAEISLSQDDVEHALLNVKWPGRFEVVSDEPPVIIDGAHNAAGIQSLVATLSREGRWNQMPIVLVLGATQGHDVKAMIAALKPIESRLLETISTMSTSVRAIPSLMISELLHSRSTTNVTEAVQLAKTLAEAAKAVIVVTGSLFVAGEARGLFCEMPMDPQMPAF